MESKLNRRRGDPVQVGDSYKARARAELEKTLEHFSDAEYEELDGSVVKKITPVDLYRVLKRNEHIGSVHGKFLLYMDDRMTEFNGFRKEVQQLQKDVAEYCNDRIESCPILPMVREIEEDLGNHLSATEKAEIVTKTTESLKAKWKEEGREEERFRLEKTVKIVSLVIAIITAATGLITWFLGIWKFPLPTL